MSTEAMSGCAIGLEGELIEFAFEDGSGIKLTAEFIGFAHENAIKIYKDLNDSQGPAPKDPDVYDPFFNENGKGKNQILVWYYTITNKSPFKGDDDESCIKDFLLTQFFRMCLWIFLEFYLNGVSQDGYRKPPLVIKSSPLVSKKAC